MPINANKLINAIVKPSSGIITIIIDYGELKQKLQSPEAQTWYFNQGIEAHHTRIKALEKRFEKVRADFNNSDLDELISMLNKVKAEKKRIPQTASLMQRIKLASVLSKMKYLEDLIEIKSRVSQMMPVDYYVENPDALMKLSGWELKNDKEQKHYFTL